MTEINFNNHRIEVIESLEDINEEIIRLKEESYKWIDLTIIENYFNELTAKFDRIEKKVTINYDWIIYMK